jgi:TonB family protein
MPPVVRPILRIATFWALYQVPLTVPLAPLAATTKDDVSAEQTSSAIPESVTGLQSQLEAILQTAKEGDPEQFDDLISDLQVPENPNWFAATFGEEIGQNLVATYNSSWKDYKDDIRNMFRDIGTKKHIHVFVKGFSTSSLAHNDAFIQSILRNAKAPLVLYTAGAGKDRGSDSLPGAYVFAQGKFRVVNWRTFYDLPKVKPVRIRVGGQVALNQLIHHVNPIPQSDSLHQHVRGTVVVHAVIDRDGNVAQLEPISGPPELVNAAVEAARQWRYKPTILNGDPVEVDTTITIAFGGGG